MQTQCSSFFKNKMEYETMISGHPESFTTKGQENFTRRQNASYFQRCKTFPMDLFYDQDGIYSVVMCGNDFAALLVKKGMERKTILSPRQAFHRL